MRLLNSWLRYPYRFICGTLVILCIMAISINYFTGLPSYKNSISGTFADYSPGHYSSLGMILTLNIGFAASALAILWGHCSHQHEK